MLYQHNMQIHIILSNFKFVTLMEQNMVVLPEHMVSHTMFEFCHVFCSFCVFYLIMSVLLSWSPFFSNILLARVIFIIVTHSKFLFYRDYQINSGTQGWTVMMNWLWNPGIGSCKWTITFSESIGARTHVSCIPYVDKSQRTYPLIQQGSLFLWMFGSS
jgi:hypothetical protein